MRRTDVAQSLEQLILPYDAVTLQALGVYMLFGSLDDVTSSEVCEFIVKTNLLQQVEALILFVNSDGGNVNDGFAVIDMIETSRLPVQTVGTGLIASMALLVLAAGNKGTRTITKNTEIMAHQFTSGMYGKMHELMAITDEHLRLERLFIEHFKRHSAMTEKQIKDVLFSPSDRWLTPAECKKYGLCDRVTEFLEVPALKKSTRGA